MIDINFEKLYKDPRINEPCQIAIPFKKGELTDILPIAILDSNNTPVPIQPLITSKWDDNSVRWLFIRFFANLNGNDTTRYYFDKDYYSNTNYKDVHTTNNNIINILNESTSKQNIKNSTLQSNILLKSYEDGSVLVDTNALTVHLSTTANTLFNSIEYLNNTCDATNFSAPMLNINDNDNCCFKINSYDVVENGSVCAIIVGNGSHVSNSGTFRCEVKFTFFKDKEYFELAYRLFNTSDKPIKINSLVIKYNNKLQDIKSAVATSNYATKYDTSDNGELLSKIIDSDYLIYDANEHLAETFYGTFFADITSKSENFGLAITQYQAYQNFPKGFNASSDGIDIMIIPENVTDITFQSGMSRQQKMLFHFHQNDTPLTEINRVSTIYQMPDRPYIDKECYHNANVFEDIYYNNENPSFESHIRSKADSHARCYGLLNWGDSPDPGYTSQGRGLGELVWTNNEYDYPHQAALLYSRTATRRYLDYLFVTAEHWIDVDICHYSNDPLIMNGQWMHTNNHCLNSKIVCSHEWVEGLLDYYHFTGDRYAFDCAINIGDNILRLLDTDTFKQKGEISARETGWALRSMVALYKETFDKKWLAKCDWIVGHFKEWEDTYGHWLSPYMDTVTIRVPFMISIAACSLMRYYRINHDEDLKQLILRQIDDLIDNCYTPMGVFYYKELPSLARLGNNTIILEALTYAYELTNNKDYLTYGISTFKNAISSSNGGGGAKKVVKDTVIVPGPGTKTFAQSHLPLTIYYKALCDANMLDLI